MKMFQAGKWIVLIGLVSILAACGGGGGGGTTANQDQSQNQAANRLSGVAAAGAPIIGRAYLKDSASPANTLGPTEIAAEGGFSFDVTNLTAPFYLQAEGTVGGQSYKLHSVAMLGATTANINPLTDLAVAAAAGVNDPETVYNDPATNAITSDALATAIADMMATLQPLLDAYSANTDFLTGSYTADHTGLDGMLDVVEVEINTATGAVTINDRIADTQIAAMTTTTVGAPTDPISTTEATASVTAVTDLQGIASTLSGFATALNKGSNLLAADLDPYVASDASFGIHDGANRTQFINDILEGASGADMPISSISGVSIIKTEGSVYTISAVFHWSDGRTDTNQFTFTNEGGLWKIKGNGYKADVDVQFSAEKSVSSDGTATVTSGLRVDVEDNWNHGLQSAVITGPGLPDAGYIMAKGTSDAVDMEPYGWNDGNHYHIYPISDATIGTMPATDLTYTVVVKDTQGATVETQTVTLPQRPYKESELTSGHFIQVSGISNLNTSSLNMGGTLSFTYAKPTAYQVAMLGVEVGYSNTTGLWDATDKELYLTGTSGSIVTLAPQGDVTGGWLRLDADDIYGRNVVVEYSFSPSSTTAFPGTTTSGGGIPDQFSMEWLSGKTLYQVWFGSGEVNGISTENVPVVVKVVFGADGNLTYTGLLNSGSGTIAYGVDATGSLYFGGDTTKVNSIVPGSTADYIRTNYVDNGVADNVDLYFFDEAKALAYAGTLSASIP